VVVSVVVVLFVSITASCSAPTHNDAEDQLGSPAAQKSGSGELRTDAEPVTTRFSALDAPRQVRWMSGTYGSPRTPGPSTYWIDAVVTLDAATAEELVSTYSPTPTSDVPDVVNGMREHLPPGPFHVSATLDDAFDEGRWWASAYLDPQAATLVLVATGT
jgi:hypothetical protein